MIAFLALSGTPAFADIDPAVAVEIQASTTMKTERGLPNKPKPLLNIQAELEKRRASSTEKMRELKEKASSTRDKMDQIARKVLRNRFENMLIRFEATIEREESIMSRIVSRIEKVKTDGGNTTKSEEFITEAKKHLAEAKVTLETLKADAKIAAELEADPTLRLASTTRSSLINLRKTSQDLSHHLRETHKALVNAVSNLLGMSSTKPKLQATTTATTTVNTQN